MNKEIVNRINIELAMNKVPIKVIDENTLEVYTVGFQGKKHHKITRNDVNAFEVDINTGFATLGTIVGDWRMIENIYDYCKRVFEEIDSASKSS
ncbi:MAG: hypothetical protein QW478_13660 [Candidatus Micrarchaeaceae archaeon]